MLFVNKLKRHFHSILLTCLFLPFFVSASLALNTSNPSSMLASFLRLFLPRSDLFNSIDPPCKCTFVWIALLHLSKPGHVRFIIMTGFDLLLEVVLLLPLSLATNRGGKRREKEGNQAGELSELDDWNLRRTPTACKEFLEVQSF